MPHRVFGCIPDPYPVGARSTPFSSLVVMSNKGFRCADVSWRATSTWMESHCYNPMILILVLLLEVLRSNFYFLGANEISLWIIFCLTWMEEMSCENSPFLPSHGFCKGSVMKVATWPVVTVSLQSSLPLASSTAWVRWAMCLSLRTVIWTMSETTPFSVG